jgi:Ca-activated chloride channel family protein
MSRLTVRGGLLLVALITPVVLGQGRIYIEPVEPPVRPVPGVPGTQLLLKGLQVETQITDGVAVATVQQKFQNPYNRQIEGTYVFPLPGDVSVGDFSMRVGDKTLSGEVLEADKARGIYERIVAQYRDPGLLEFLGNRLFRARVFPIPPKSDVDITLKFTQTLAEVDGLGCYAYPLRSPAPGPGQMMYPQVTVDVKMSSQTPLATVFCPSHECSITQPDSHHARVSFESSHYRAAQDFKLYYQRTKGTFGMTLLTHRRPAADGFFLLRLAPSMDEKVAAQPKDIVFVVDTSGSMAGEKLVQTQAALKYCINSLKPEDRFNIIPFSVEARRFRESLVPAEDAVRKDALQYTDELVARGGTNINDALLAALESHTSNEERPYLVVFLTDGLPTVGTTSIDEILANVRKANIGGVRVHVLGVGVDVNTKLLDSLAADTRGTRTYCTETDELEVTLSGFAVRLGEPLLTDIKLTFEGGDVEQMYPKQISDLFRGGELTVLGRYAGSGGATVRLTGKQRDGTKEIVEEITLPAVDTGQAFLPQLWANRKVAYLLDEMRRNGENEELVAEVVRLATTYGIVTPYTSALILEDNVRLAEYWGEWNRRGRRGGVPPAPRPDPQAAERMGRVAMGGSPASATAGLRKSSGAASVTASMDIARELESLGYAGGGRGQAGEAVTAFAGGRAFVKLDGRWVDSAWDGEQKAKRVVAYSKKYFELLRDQAELREYLALGEHVLIVLGDGEVVEIVPPDLKASDVADDPNDADAEDTNAETP